MQTRLEYDHQAVVTNCQRKLKTGTGSQQLRVIARKIQYLERACPPFQRFAARGAYRILFVFLLLFSYRSAFAESPLEAQRVLRSKTPGKPGTERKLYIAPFEVREAAGIRRRSDVVSARYVFKSPITEKMNFRVMQDGETVPSQIRPVKNTSGEISAVTIDFVANFAPMETRQYELVYGANLTTTQEPTSGFELKETDDAFLISNRDRIVWTVQRDLSGLFRFRRNPDVEYVKPISAGLLFRDTGGTEHRLADQKPTAVRVTRQGPIASALEYQFNDWPKGGRSTVELEFVRSKSWARVTWTVESAMEITGMSAELSLDLEGREKLIDFGADDFVYATVKEDETAILTAGPITPDEPQHAWTVQHGKSDSLAPFVVGQPGQSTTGIGGWAHVLDDTRCTAVAVGDFAKSTRDRIEVDGSGRLLMAREFDEQSDSAATKKFEFWVHFVSVPVHIGARTSPQAMRSPLQVRWLD